MSEVLSEKSSGYIKIMRHADGFEWKAYYDAEGEFTYAIPEGGNRCPRGYMAAIGDSKYMFDGTDFVFKEKLPTYKETQDRMTTLCKKLRDTGARAMLVTVECNECDREIEETFIIWPKSHRPVHFGCYEAFRRLRSDLAVDSFGFFTGSFNRNLVETVHDNYMTFLNDLEDAQNEYERSCG